MVTQERQGEEESKNNKEVKVVAWLRMKKTSDIDDSAGGDGGEWRKAED